jgi:hypothetical protein
MVLVIILSGLRTRMFWMFLATSNQSVLRVEMHVISSHILIYHGIFNGKIAK